MSFSIILPLLPPILVLVIRLITRRVVSAIMIGIFAASFIATQGSLFDATVLSFGKLYNNLELNRLFGSEGLFGCWNILICFFLIVVGTIISAIRAAGGTQAYISFIKGYLHNKRAAEGASLVLSLFLFIDDYFSSLTVGATMQPIADQHKIPRVKLAFLIDALAAPLTVLCPLSTWAAAILGFLRDNGISETMGAGTLVLGKPLCVYFHILPYMFYSFLIMFAAWVIVQTRTSYGLMEKFELSAERKIPHEETLASRMKGDNIKHQLPHSMIDFVVPIVFLTICVFIGLLYSGGWWLTGGERPLLEALPKANAAIALFVGGVLAFLSIFSFLIVRKRLLFQQIPGICYEGIRVMLPSIIILILAWALGDLLRNDLHTGRELANLMSSIHLSNVNLLPLAFFLCAFAMSSTIGSSWGTAAILFPIAIPMILTLTQNAPGIAADNLHILYPALGAILSGCMAGDHISPISDTTVMTSHSTHVKHMDHVSTQMGYTLPVVAATAFAFYLLSICASDAPYTAIVLSVFIAFCSYLVFIGSIGFVKYLNKERQLQTTYSTLSEEG
ncbi:MAG TPA: Na+/H+ antiporter NhaC family protein [Gammaproteobacteria bacterium]|nr:Na+/H+ antiporter NhaC family protein [Gammaproteobacteria bacterium]